MFPIDYPVCHQDSQSGLCQIGMGTAFQDLQMIRDYAKQLFGVGAIFG